MDKNELGTSVARVRRIVLSLFDRRKGGLLRGAGLRDPPRLHGEPVVPALLFKFT
jgi:hypothetical protein